MISEYCDKLNVASHTGEITCVRGFLKDHNDTVKHNFSVAAAPFVPLQGV